jgi:hypothetical protein
MKIQRVALCEKLRGWLFARKYGAVVWAGFDLISDTVAIQDQLVFVEGVERRSGNVGRKPANPGVKRVLRTDLLQLLSFIA